MVEATIQPFSIVSGLLVFVSTILGLFANYKKVSKKDFVASLDLVGQELQKQRDANTKLSEQLKEKQAQLDALKAANYLEETILENRDPKLEQTLALLAHGQVAILEMLKGGETHDQSNQ